MSDLILRATGHLADPLTGPLHFRLIILPCVPVVLAVLDGVYDAEIKRRPYLRSLVTAAGRRRQMLKAGWRSIRKVFVIALVLDAAYQLMVLKFFYPGEAIVMACVLAILPYVVVRRLVTRLLAGGRLSA